MRALVCNQAIDLYSPSYTMFYVILNFGDSNVTNAEHTTNNCISICALEWKKNKFLNIGKTKCYGRYFSPPGSFE